MTAVWPAGLPQYLEADGFNEQLADARLDTPTDYGPGKTRRKFTKNWRQISGAIRCTDDQVDTFEEFYLETLNGGALDFLWKAPLTQNAAMMRFRGGPPKIQYRSADEHLISFQLFQKYVLADFRFDSGEVSFDSTLDTFDAVNTY
jgi:hypothetical protein